MDQVVPLHGEGHGAGLRPRRLGLERPLQVHAPLDDALQEGLEAASLLGLLEAAPLVGQGEGVQDHRLRVREGLGGKDVGAEEGQAPRDAREEELAIGRHHHELPEPAFAGERGDGGAASQARDEGEVLDDLDGRGGGQVVMWEAQDEAGEVLAVHGEGDAVQEGPDLALVGDREVLDGKHFGDGHPRVGIRMVHPPRAPVK